MEGTVVLNLPGPAAPESRAALVDAVLNGLRYAIHCEGPGSTRDLTVEGGGTVSIGLAAGRWHISVEAEYQGISAGRGEGDVEVRAGASNTADITMSPTEEFASPLITGEPRDTVIFRLIGGPSLEVQAMSVFGRTLSYQWYSNTTDSNTGGAAIAGETDPGYTPPDATLGTTYYYVAITGADQRTRTSEAVEVRVINPESLTIINAKDSEGGAYGVGEPFQYQIKANYAGDAYDITEWVSADHFDDFSSTSTSVSIASTSPLNGIPYGPVLVTVKTLAQRVAEANTAGGSHTLLVYAANETMPGVSTASSTDANITQAAITLKSSDETAGGIRNLNLTSNGAMFYIYGSGAKLSLDRNITLNGSAANTASLVRVESSGILIMEADSVISRNINTTGSGGGVYVYGNGAKFTMNGGTISDNEANNGGGVYLDTGGTFNMGGSVSSISGNKATGNGGGVYIYASGTFTMSGSASISDNDAADGGGVSIGFGTFTMKEFASIIDNGATTNGGGVYFGGGTFTMNDSTFISGNEAVDGGGVYIHPSLGGTFNMNGSASSISGNKASGDGGGVYQGKDNFNMSGGTISGNEAANGGGVFVIDGASFTMNGGTIGGTSTEKNTASLGAGVYVEDGTFTMGGSASISYNEASSDGGGVFVYANLSSASFTMSGDASITNNKGDAGGGVGIGSGTTFTMDGSASITQNEASTKGGGVDIYDAGFTMGGSAFISGNKVTTGHGGGVHMYYATFTMDGAASFISGNEASGDGGGVYVDSGIFTLTHGTVYGTDDPAHQNTAGGTGDALYVFSGGTATAGSSPLGPVEDNTITQ